MQAQIKLKCHQCQKQIRPLQFSLLPTFDYLLVDTGDLDEHMAEIIRSTILAHRQQCPYYKTK